MCLLGSGLLSLHPLGRYGYCVHYVQGYGSMVLKFRDREWMELRLIIESDTKLPDAAKPQ